MLSQSDFLKLFAMGLEIVECAPQHLRVILLFLVGMLDALERQLEVCEL